MHSIIDEIANYLGFSRDEVIKISENSPFSYRRYKIKKKNGGMREIFHPAKQTKALQYAIIECLLIKNFPVHECAKGYIRGVKSPLLVNASSHAKYPYSIHLDFKDFFPSIRPIDLFKIMKKNNEYSCFTSSDYNFIENCLFISRRGQKYLAIGSPASPLVSNIVMYSLDERFLSIAKYISEKSIYSRYADDIVFSTNKKGGCSKFREGVIKVLNKNKFPLLQLNEGKTIFTSKGTRRVVTGLYVCPDGKVSIGRERKRYIKKLINDFKYNVIKQKDLAYLRGYLCFILDVEPDFYNRLVLKYTGDLFKKIWTNK
jgi:RNA-directed DNA polymerase